MLWIGRQVGGVAAIVLGALMLWWGSFSEPWHTLPVDASLASVLAYVVAMILIVAGAGLFIERTAKAAALVLAALFAVSTALKIPVIAQAPRVFDGWGNLAEQSAVMAGYLAAFAALMPRGSATAARLALGTRIWFGCCAVMFGANHFVYLDACADFVPTWIPGGGVFWSAVTGAAHIAAGIAILSGVWALLAARLAVVMYLGFGILAWGNALVTKPTDHFSWSGEVINFTLVPRRLDDRRVDQGVFAIGCSHPPTARKASDRRGPDP